MSEDDARFGQHDNRRQGRRWADEEAFIACDQVGFDSDCLLVSMSI